MFGLMVGLFLGLAESADGILPLPDDAPVGESFRAWLGLDDRAIELDLTPDRADCLSVAGVAREVGVLNVDAGVDDGDLNLTRAGRDSPGLRGVDVYVGRQGGRVHG
mgnify:CR=1 FL=1